MSRKQIFLVNHSKYHLHLLRPDQVTPKDWSMGKVQYESPYPDEVIGWGLERHLVASIGDPGWQEEATSGNIILRVGDGSPTSPHESVPIMSPRTRRTSSSRSGTIAPSSGSS